MTRPKLPVHKNPKADRMASAPYNFVPLPETVVTVASSADELPDHHRSYEERVSGFFGVSLTTMSPLYIRCGQPKESYSKEAPPLDFATPSSKKNDDRARFFHTHDSSLPVIPGSSLRGMLRNLLEIVSYGKMERITDKQLFFRTVDDSAVGKLYGSRMTNKVKSGFLIQREDSYFIKPCDFVRAKAGSLPQNRHLGSGPNKRPDWQYQYKPVWIDNTTPRNDNRAAAAQVKFEQDSALREGRLVITGDVPGKTKEFVFLIPAADITEIPVTEKIIDQFHDDDQLTQWQERAFPKDQPQPSSGFRRRNGLLMSNVRGWEQPIFYVEDEQGRLVFIGRAGMFRLPYKNSPKDLVPEALRRPEDIDFADAMFGFVRTKDDVVEMKRRGMKAAKQGDKLLAFAGRVSVTEATLAPSQEVKNLWLSDAPMIPKILGSPKPTAFQHYLVQKQPDYKEGLSHYDSASEATAIRGFKQYWHQGAENGVDISEFKRMIDESAEARQKIAEQSRKNEPDTQHTLIRPLRPDVQFTFRVYFENLSREELGALCWILHPVGVDGKQYCHKLGMGKALGMGSVCLEAQLTLVDRARRYSTLLAENDWVSGHNESIKLSDRAALLALTLPFEQFVLAQVKPQGQQERLFGVERIATLLKMLEWPGQRSELEGNVYLDAHDRPNTRCMTVSEFRGRRVLPTPEAFGGFEGVVLDRSQFAAAGRSPMAAALLHATVSAKNDGPEVSVEMVTMLGSSKSGKARVRTEANEECNCTKVPAYPTFQPGKQLKAEITRSNGNIQQAVFKAWY